MKAKASFCPDCGPASVDHIFEKGSIIFDRFVFSPVAKPMDWMRRKVDWFLNFFSGSTYGIILFRLFTALHLGKIVEKPDSKNSDRAKVFWIEAEKRGINMREFRLFGLARDIYFATFKDKSLIWDGLPRKGQSASVYWMDDKGLLKRHFLKASIPVAQGGICFREKTAIKTFHTLEAPFITKPNLGSRSRHTTIHIHTEEEMKKAFNKAKQLSPWVVVEEELFGRVYRITLINRKVAAVMRRDPPLVIGDGVRSVQELAVEENKNPLRQGPIFHTINLDNEAQEELERQDLTLQSIPEKNKVVTLNQKVSRSFGATSTDVTNEVHEDNIKLFEKIGEVLDDPLVGIDFIIGDMSKSWQEQKRLGVIECNSCPFIDLHHYPYRGSIQNVAGKLWDFVLPESIAESIRANQ